MKKTIYLLMYSFFIFLLIYGFIFITSEEKTSLQPPPVPPDTTSFLLGAMNNRLDVNYTNIANPDVFGMNLQIRIALTIC